MDGRHPDLVAADQALNDGNAEPIVALAFRSRWRMEEGIYCECSDPIIPGDALMCERCLFSQPQPRDRSCPSPR